MFLYGKKAKDWINEKVQVKISPTTKPGECEKVIKILKRVKLLEAVELKKYVNSEKIIKELKDLELW